MQSSMKLNIFTKLQKRKSKLKIIMKTLCYFKFIDRIQLLG